MSNPNKLETQRSKLPNGQRPKGPGWVLKKSGEQSGKPHSEWERKTNICVRKNMSNPEIRAIKVLLDELEQEFNPEELSSPNATVKLLDVQITLYDLRKLMIMQERK